MSENAGVRFFLGANTARGFCSLFEPFTDESRAERVWYIKGGPGNGKSTFMRTVAQAAESAGCTVEYAMCSGDPVSLDAIRILETDTVYADSTAPHVLEPKLPGTAGRYLDLSVFYKRTVSCRRERIREINAGCSGHYVRAYDLLHAADLCRPDGIPGAVTENDTAALCALARETAESLLSPGSGYRERRVFLSAYTCRGEVVLPELMEKTGRVFLLQSAFGLVDPYLREIERLCRQNGVPVILCLDPLDPDRLEGICLPENDLAFYQFRRRKKLPGRLLELDRVIPEAQRSEYAAEAKNCRALSASLLRQAVSHMEQAKALHDELESELKPFVDFTALTKFCQKHIRDFI